VNDGEVVSSLAERVLGRVSADDVLKPGTDEVIVEAGGSSQWVSRLIERLGHEVVVVSPRHVKVIAQSSMKTDEIDAEILARLGRIDLGLLGRATHRSEQSQMLQGRLTVRGALVDFRTQGINTVRGILRGFGYRVSKGSTPTFHERAAKIDLPDELRQVIDPLLTQLKNVTEEIKRIEKDLRAIAKDMPVIKQLREIPGVGLIVALSFVVTIDDPDRFRKSRSVGAFVGMRPSVRNSGGIQHFGRITKEGDSEMRRLLIQAAHSMMRSGTRCHLQIWASELAARRGKQKALVALGRKIAVLMHRLWVTGEVFNPFPNEVAA
jgi:transposase